MAELEPILNSFKNNNNNNISQFKCINVKIIVILALNPFDKSNTSDFNSIVEIFFLEYQQKLMEFIMKTNFIPQNEMMIRCVCVFLCTFVIVVVVASSIFVL